MILATKKSADGRLERWLFGSPISASMVEWEGQQVVALCHSVGCDHKHPDHLSCGFMPSQGGSLQIEWAETAD